MASDMLIGRQIGEFTVQEVIGRGGMATVYRATQPLMRRDVALKVIAMNDTSDKTSEFMARFASEAKLIASLENPHVLPVYSYGFASGVAYLSMRMLRGGSLEDQLRGEPLPLVRALDLFHQIAQGLAYAHSKGIIHRDIKPSNILLDSEGHAYLTDFGLAKLIDGDAGFTKTGQIMGTPVYMSPEQLKGEPLDFRSDVYALGCILYELVTGVPPFSPVDGDVIPVIFNHLQTPPPAPSARGAQIPPALEAVIMAALAKSPADRHASVREMANAALQAVGRVPTGSFPVPADVIVNRTQQITAPASRRRTRRIVATLALMLVAGAGLAIGRAALHGTAYVPPYSAEQVLMGQQASLDSLMPSEAEYALASRAMGEDGFIALIPCNIGSEYYAALTREQSQFARERGLSTRIYDPDTDAYRQMTLLESAVAEGARAIILCPLDMELIAPTLTEIRRIGIPLVTQAGNMGKFGGVQILVDNHLLGLRPGEYIGQLVRDELGGSADIVVLAFDDLPDVRTRADGMIEGVAGHAANARVVARVEGGTPEKGYESIRQLLDTGTPFNVILSINDAGAAGAFEALQEAGIPYGDVIIGSVDAEVIARRYIREGKYFRASIEAGRTVYASAAIDVIVKLLAGGEVPELIFIPPGELITRESFLVTE